MAHIYITYELLALFIEGKTTAEESALILKAAKKNEEIRNIIQASINAGTFWKSETKVSENPASQGACKVYALHQKHLPVMRMAASSKANDCVVKCEQFVLALNKKDSEYEKLVKKAKKQEWLKADGTPLYNIGRLSELAQMSVARRFGGTIEMLQNELDGECSIIVALNAKCLADPTVRGGKADHAVVVVDINQEENTVEIFDPQSPEPIDTYDIDTFMKAWKASKNYFVSVVERGVRPYTPHPEYVAHIKLPEEVAAIADMLAENAHEVWAKDRMAEYEKKNADASADPFMKPFSELSKAKRTSDYKTALNTIKLIYKLGFKIESQTSEMPEYTPNVRKEDGRYIPNPLSIDDVELPAEVSELTEYIAENAHEEWAKQRMKEGWTFAPKTDKQKKQSFDLVPYCELIDSEKEYDRKMAMQTLKVLYKFGYKIEK